MISSVPAPKKVLISVVVLTKNEEERLARCLDSVKWADEIIVVDDESRDATVEIARRYTDRVLVKKMDIQGKHRNWADAQARNLWVLSLDADEVVTPELKEEIIGVLGNKTVESGFTIPRRNYIGDYWVRYGGWYPSGQLKFFRKDRFKWEEAEVHCRAFLEGACGHLKGDIIHYSYRNVEDFWAKLNRQSSWEARKWFNQGKPMRLGRFIWRTIDRFCRAYFWKKGYKDGFMGFIVAFNAALYQFISYLKYREIVLTGSKIEKKRGRFYFLESIFCFF
jgi:glycosyltransferase involved in cell wall biosynthesis